MQCVCFLKHNEIMAGNLRGQMKIWDLRSPLLQPSMTFLVSGEPIAATCLTVHPSQKHIVFAGGEDGFITIWDLRQGTSPVTLLEAHSSSGILIFNNFVKEVDQLKELSKKSVK